MKTYASKVTNVNAIQLDISPNGLRDFRYWYQAFKGEGLMRSISHPLDTTVHVRFPKDDGEYSNCVLEHGQWLLHSKGEFWVMTHEEFKEFYTEVPEERQSNLVDHAKRELEIIGEEPEVVEAYLKIVRIFAEMGHSGASAMFAVPVIEHLLAFKPLSDLTDDPEDWIHHGEDVWGEKGGIWQNRRNGQAFSKDGGKTYYLLSDNSNSKVQTMRYTSKEHKK